jgi:hypothetical protein
MHRAIQWHAAGILARVNLVHRLVWLIAITGILIVLPGCKSPAPTEIGPDRNIAGVSTAGLRLGMTPGEVREVSARRLYKEDEKNKDTLAGLMEKEKEQSTIRLNRVRTLTTHESFAFYSNAVTLTLQFARNRLIQLEERHTGLGDEDLRTVMREVSTQFPFVIDRVDTSSGAQWQYHGKTPGAFVRIDSRIVPTTKGQPTPMSSYTVVVADPLWATVENPKHQVPITREASSSKD